MIPSNITMLFAALQLAFQKDQTSRTHLRPSCTRGRIAANPPWSGAAFVVTDSAGQKLAYVYLDDRPRKILACSWQSC
jgi:hypothetical protein